ncbi:MAG TPA: aldehyde dehydrogenase family protein, partial [Burkholderiaceae bacterium]|nr:aldehyde dehydrogenase family protein [Burkholderiaceae bacterium]
RIAIGSLVAADAAAVDRAVQAARAARADWRGTPWPQRIAMLCRAADAIRRDRFEIAMGLVYEVGKSRLEAMGEVEESIDLIDYYCEQAEQAQHWQRPLRPGSATETGSDRLVPYGVFAVISPFNFPLALAVGMTSSALLAGNTVVWKPSPGAAFSAPALARAYREAGLPDGVFNFVAGDRDVGQALIEHPGVDGVAFTGSHEVGMAIARRMLAGAFARPVLAELGGKNAAFVTASADLDAAASGVARAAFGLSGQKCSSCSKVYVARALEREFLERLAAIAERLVVGDPTQARTFTGPVIDAAAAARFEQAVAQARADGRVVAGGRRLAAADAPELGERAENGAYLRPTIVAGLPPEHPVNRRELFVPLVSVQPYDALADAIDDSNRSALGLTSGIYCRDERELALYYDRIEAGVLYVNRASGATTGAWPGYQTFCGWKGSGTTGKGGLGPYYVTQFMREQSRTVAR